MFRAVGSGLSCAMLFSMWAAADPLPNHAITPGVADPRATVEKICGTRWGKSRRHVTAAMRREVFAAYGMTGNRDPQCHPNLSLI